jgi:hypothetical protein
MSEVVETMRIHGYDIEFVQRGIRGTYVRVVRCPIKKEEGDEESSD